MAAMFDSNVQSLVRRALHKVNKVDRVNKAIDSGYFLGMFKSFKDHPNADDHPAASANLRIVPRYMTR